MLRLYTWCFVSCISLIRTGQTLKVEVAQHYFFPWLIRVIFEIKRQIIGMLLLISSHHIQYLPYRWLCSTHADLSAGLSKHFDMPRTPLRCVLHADVLYFASLRAVAHEWQFSMYFHLPQLIQMKSSWPNRSTFISCSYTERKKKVSSAHSSQGQSHNLHNEIAFIKPNLSGARIWLLWLWKVCSPQQHNWSLSRA